MTKNPLFWLQRMCCCIPLRLVKVNPGSSFEKKPPGIKKPQGIAYNHLVHFNAFIIPIILYQFQKDPFCLIILYDILFYYYMYIKHPGKRKQPWGTMFLMQAKGFITLIIGCMFQKIALPSDFMHIFL